MIDLISSDDLNIEQEETVFEAIVRWFHYDPIARREEFVEVMKYVRLPLLSPYFLEDLVANLPVVENSAEAQAILREARYFHELPNRRSEWTSPRCRLRKASGWI